MKKILGLVMVVLWLGCQQDSDKSSLANTKWVGIDPDDALLNYWALATDRHSIIMTDPTIQHIASITRYSHIKASAIRSF
jgi:hypothetical protein